MSGRDVAQIRVAAIAAAALSHHVAMTPEAEAGPTGALRRSTAAEISVMITPTGKGSMKV